MPDLSLRTAMANYGHTKPLIEGTLTSDRVAIEHVPVSPITTAFRRMVRGLEYDVSEMALSTYLCALVYGKAITALPVFVLRRFEHDGIVYNTKSGIKSPAELKGRKVGVRSYTLTPGVWARGVLSDTYGVDASQVTWVLFGDEHVAEYQAPDNVISAPEGSDIMAALQSGEIDAALGVRSSDSPEIQPLIPDLPAAVRGYFNDTGIYPISHTIVVKNELLENHPWLAGDLYQLFQGGKERYLEQLNAADNLEAPDLAMNRLKEVVGPDPLPYGVEANRTALEAFMKFNVEQGIIPRPFALEEIFAPC